MLASLPAPLLAQSVKQSHQKIYTNLQTYDYPIKTDGQSVEYRLWQSGRLLRTDTVRVSNPQSAIKTTKLALPLKTTGEYKLEYRVLDEVDNSTIWYQQIIDVNRAIPILGLLSLSECAQNLCLELHSNKQADLLDERGNTLATVTAGIQTITLLQDFQWDKAYSFKLKLLDRYGNLSEFQEISHQTPALAALTGEVFGANQDYPWGKDSQYAQQPGSARLWLQHKLASNDTYYFENISIPAPLLTYTDIKNEVMIYGNAVSKSSDLHLQVWQRFPSYQEARQFCNTPASNLSEYIRINTDCLQSALGISNFADFSNEVQRHCRASLLPWQHQECVGKLYNKQREAFLDAATVKIGHVLVKLFKADGSKLAELWQEGSTNFLFRLNSSQLRPGELVRAQTQIFGDLNFRGKSYSYRNQHSQLLSNYGLSSELSNKLALTASSKTAKALARKCENSACQILNVDYFNQGVNAQGKWEEWPGWYAKVGTKSCGAASAVMAASKFGKLLSSSSLKSNVFSDNGQKLSSKRCNRPGAFALTSYDSNCNQSSSAGIKAYLNQQGLNVKLYSPNRANWKIDIDKIRSALSKGHPIILSYSKPIGHILLVKGITYDNQLIVNDPYRDFQNDYRKGVYDYSGQDAIYSLYPSNKFVVNFFMEVGD